MTPAILGKPRSKSTIPTNTPVVRLNLFAGHLLVDIRDFADPSRGWKPPPAAYLSGRRFLLFSAPHNETASHIGGGGIGR
ncbi:hypothetical protein ABIA95_004920 [Bradyrhizobium sp. LA8.1]